MPHETRGQGTYLAIGCGGRVVRAVRPVVEAN